MPDKFEVIFFTTIQFYDSNQLQVDNQNGFRHHACNSLKLVPCPEFCSDEGADHSTFTKLGDTFEINSLTIGSIC